MSLMRQRNWTSFAGAGQELPYRIYLSRLRATAMVGATREYTAGTVEVGEKALSSDLFNAKFPKVIERL